MSRHSEKHQFEGLEQLLKSHYSDENLRVISTTTTNLLSPGENYCSEMLKVDVTIVKADNHRNEELHLVAKTNVFCDKPIINWPQAFKKELFVYAELLPIYREIEREAGIDDEDLIDVLPRYVGCVNSLRSDASDIDEGSVLLMENLKSRGYYTVDKRVGLNVRQASIALASLARYHALGTATKRKRPSVFARAVEHANRNSFDPSARSKTLDPIRQLFRSCPRLAKYLSELETSLDEYNRLKNLRSLDPEEPWCTINHGDFHANNVMFREDASGDVDDAKIVDFQTYFYSSPLVDLPLFLCLSLDESCAAGELDGLLDVYYENFARTLRRVDCDTGCFSRSAFDLELKKQARMVFSRVAIVVLVLTFQVDKEDKVSGELLNEVSEWRPSRILEKNMIDLIEVYERRGWLGLK